MEQLVDSVERVGPNIMTMVIDGFSCTALVQVSLILLTSLTLLYPPIYPALFRLSSIRAVTS